MYRARLIIFFFFFAFRVYLTVLYSLDKKNKSVCIKLTIKVISALKSLFSVFIKTYNTSEELIYIDKYCLTLEISLGTTEAARNSGSKFAN